jgi:hypothetical protein
MSESVSIKPEPLSEEYLGTYFKEAKDVKSIQTLASLLGSKAAEYFSNHLRSFSKYEAETIPRESLELVLNLCKLASREIDRDDSTFNT